MNAFGFVFIFYVVKNRRVSGNGKMTKQYL